MTWVYSQSCWVKCHELRPLFSESTRPVTESAADDVASESPSLPACLVTVLIQPPGVQPAELGASCRQYHRVLSDTPPCRHFPSAAQHPHSASSAADHTSKLGESTPARSLASTLSSTSVSQPISQPVSQHAATDSDFVRVQSCWSCMSIGLSLHACSPGQPTQPTDTCTLP